MGALLGALSSLFIFNKNIGSFIIAIKIILPFIMTRIAFNYRSLKNYMINTVFLFCISFLFGGLMLFIIVFLNPPNISYFNGFFYFNINPIALFTLTIICYTAISIYKKIFASKCPEKLIYKVYIKRNSATVVLDGFIDSGNKLTEPFSGFPVAVCGLRQLKCLFTKEEYEMLKSKDLENYPRGFKLIPYNTVGKCGILKCFVPDEFICKNEENVYRVDEIAVAIGDDELNSRDFNILLPQNILFEKEESLIDAYCQYLKKERERF